MYDATNTRKAILDEIDAYYKDEALNIKYDKDVYENIFATALQYTENGYTTAEAVTAAFEDVCDLGRAC